MGKLQPTCLFKSIVKRETNGQNKCQQNIVGIMHF